MPGVCVGIPRTRSTLAHSVHSTSEFSSSSPERGADGFTVQYCTNKLYTYTRKSDFSRAGKTDSVRANTRSV